MVPIGEWRKAPEDAYIVGLKELPEGETDPLRHTHIFFAHCFKNQGGWTDILGRFDEGKGTILDLEFLNDTSGRRVAAFGYHAGFAGAAIGVDDWCHQKLNPGQPLPPYKPFPNEATLISHIKERLGRAGKNTSRKRTKPGGDLIWRAGQKKNEGGRDQKIIESSRMAHFFFLGTGSLTRHLF